MAENTVLPPNPPADVSEEKLAELISAALKAYLAHEAKRAVTHRETPVYAVHNDRVQKSSASFPHYNWDPSHAEKAISLLEVKALLDYLWNNGQCRASFSSSDPKRFSWDIHVVSQWLFCYLTRALAKQARSNAMLGKDIVDWHLEPDIFELCVELLVKEVATGCKKLHAQTILDGVSGIEADVKIADGVYLVPFKGLTACEFLSRTCAGLTQHEEFRLGMAVGHSVLLDVTDDLKLRSDTGVFGWECRAYANEAMIERINAAKWSMARAVEKPAAPVESPVFVLDALDGEGTAVLDDALRRDSRGGGPTYQLTDEKIDRISVNAERILRIAPKSSDVSQALWYWGRSATQSLVRDAVLDAACGLELLLVSQSGEISFRFRLHGGALLAGARDRTETLKDLKNIYNSRSSAAHGQGFKGKREIADTARDYLAAAIQRVLELHDDGILDACQKSVAQQIEERVLETARVRP